MCYCFGPSIFRAYWCSECELKTNGVIDDGKRTCPICRRELWRCSSCYRLTFGIKEDANQCQCGGRRA